MTSAIAGSEFAALNLGVPSWSLSYIISFFLILSFLIIPVSTKNKIKLGQSQSMNALILFFTLIFSLCLLENGLAPKVWP